MPRKILLNQVTLCADGSIGVQLLKQVIEGGEIVAQEPHRFSIDFEFDTVAQIEEVSKHLASMGYPELTASMVDMIKKIDRIGLNDPSISAVREAKIAQRRAG